MLEKFKEPVEEMIDDAIRGKILLKKNSCKKKKTKKKKQKKKKEIKRG